MAGKIELLGTSYLDTIELARAMGQDQGLTNALLKMIRQGDLSSALMTQGVEQILLDKVHYLEQCCEKPESAPSKKTLQTMLNIILSDTRTYQFDGRDFYNEMEFGNYLQIFADASLAKLKQKVKKLYIDEYNLDPNFEAWLINLGKIKEVAAWRSRFVLKNPEEEDDEEEEIIFPEEIVKRRKAFRITQEEFDSMTKGFRERFMQTLKDYPEIRTDAVKFEGYMRDLYPQEMFLVYLLVTLFKMGLLDIMRRSAKPNGREIRQFQYRLVRDLDVKEEYAQWAVDTWCQSWKLIG